MPRYFFNILDGRAYEDDVGTELPDDRAARDEAVSILSQTIQTFAKDSFWSGESWSVRVSEKDGRKVARITVQASKED